MKQLSAQNYLREIKEHSVVAGPATFTCIKEEEDRKEKKKSKPNDKAEKISSNTSTPLPIKTFSSDESEGQSSGNYWSSSEDESAPSKSKKASLKDKPPASKNNTPAESTAPTTTTEQATNKTKKSTRKTSPTPATTKNESGSSKTTGQKKNKKKTLTNSASKQRPTTTDITRDEEGSPTATETRKETADLLPIVSKEHTANTTINKEESTESQNTSTVSTLNNKIDTALNDKTDTDIASITNEFRNLLVSTQPKMSSLPVQSPPVTKKLPPIMRSPPMVSASLVKNSLDSSTLLLSPEPRDEIAYHILDFYHQLGTKENPHIVMADHVFAERNTPFCITRFENKEVSNYAYNGYHVSSNHFVFKIFYRHFLPFIPPPLNADPRILRNP